MDKVESRNVALCDKCHTKHLHLEISMDEDAQIHIEVWCTFCGIYSPFRLDINETVDFAVEVK